MNKSDSILSANSIELHYWFNDDSHFMDAVVRNSCKRENVKIRMQLRINIF